MFYRDFHTQEKPYLYTLVCLSEISASFWDSYIHT